MAQEEGKKAAGQKAVNYIKENMIVGIGTGSTVFYFIKELIKRCEQGLNIQAVFSSGQSEKQALLGKIPCANINEIPYIDVTVDGADEIDEQFHMIKGGGGALFREKILATSSKKMIVIVDETKVVKTLGQRKLPVEILPFAFHLTINKLNQKGFFGQLRKDDQGIFYTTDNGNFIYDIHLKGNCNHPKELHDRLIAVTGVIETGLFFDVARKLIIGYEDGSTQEREA